MAITFNVDEIFEIAQQIESSAAKFYREAAKKVPEKAAQQMFVDLALMEDGHMRTFAEMRKTLTPAEKETTTFDPENQAILYLQAMADSHGTEGKKGRTELLTGQESMQEVLQIAVGAEKDSVVFYTALVDLVGTARGKEKIGAIISEELGHLATLKQMLASIK
jgi:rubrerythrin